jgi:hypothetical protein
MIAVTQLAAYVVFSTLLAADPSPYRPAVPLPTPAPTREDEAQAVDCDDPLEKKADCAFKARARCGGDYVVLSFAETGEPPAAGRVPPYKESRGYQRRRLRFRCRAAPSRSPGP